MSTEPTRVSFNPDALTEQQLDGLACVTCGTVFAPGTRSVPVAEVYGAQVFACATCVDPVESAAALDRLAAKYGLSEDVAAIRAYRPKVDAATLAARLVEHADKHAPLITGFAEEGEAELAAAFGGAALAFRSLAAALEAGEDTSRALGQLDAENARVRAALDAVRAR